MGVVIKNSTIIKRFPQIKNINGLFDNSKLYITEYTKDDELSSYVYDVKSDTSFAMPDLQCTVGGAFSTKDFFITNNMANHFSNEGENHLCIWDKNMRLQYYIAGYSKFATTNSTMEYNTVSYSFIHQKGKYFEDFYKYMLEGYILINSKKEFGTICSTNNGYATSTDNVWTLLNINTGKLKDLENIHSDNSCENPSQGSSSLVYYTMKRKKKITIRYGFTTKEIANPIKYQLDI